MVLFQIIELVIKGEQLKKVKPPATEVGVEEFWVIVQLLIWVLLPSEQIAAPLLPLNKQLSIVTLEPPKL